MTAAIVSYHLDEGVVGRPRHVERVFGELFGKEQTTVIAANFDHIRKRRISNNEAGVVRIPVTQYAGNTSVARLRSYWHFAMSLRRLDWPAEIIYICVPDYISAAVLLWCVDLEGRKVIVDVVDLWPEAVPLPPALSLVAKAVSRALISGVRSHVFRRADLLAFQSKHFLVSSWWTADAAVFLPMCSPLPLASSRVGTWRSFRNGLVVALLGSVNAITDVESLIEMLRVFSAARPTTLVLIGGGSTMASLCARATRAGAEVRALGVTFDRLCIEGELAQAHFGYNGYKRETEVAQSYKSIEYLRNGLPLLNSAKGDTAELVGRYRVGFNFSVETAEDVAATLVGMSDTEYLGMRTRAAQCFMREFTYAKFERRLEECVAGIRRPRSAI